MQQQTTTSPPSTMIPAHATATKTAVISSRAFFEFLVLVTVGDGGGCEIVLVECGVEVYLVGVSREEVGSVGDGGCMIVLKHAKRK